MDDLQNTIGGLEDFIESYKLSFNDDGYAPLEDALSLLKAQQPRVMKFTEALDTEIAWLERYANPDDGVEPIIQPVIIRYYENGYWQCLIEQDENPDLTLFIDGFNTEWRFWTARPTDAQREVTPWN